MKNKYIAYRPVVIEFLDNTRATKSYAILDADTKQFVLSAPNEKVVLSMTQALNSAYLRGKAEASND